MLKKLTKKSLSIILCVTVLLSCMVFAMPTASAAAGTYYYRITWKVVSKGTFNASYGGFNTEVNDSAGISVGYRAKNGTSETVSYVDYDIKSDMKSTGDKTTSGSCSGFPCIVYAYMDDNIFIGGTDKIQITKFEIGPSSTNLTTAWEGTMQVSTYNNPYGASIAAGSIVEPKVDYFDTDSDTYITRTAEAWDFPYAATPGTVAVSPSTITLDGQNSKTVTVTKPTGKDQYGVQMVPDICTVTYAEPYYNSSAFSINSAQNKITITKDAHIEEESANTQVLTVKAVWDSAATDNLGNQKKAKAKYSNITIYDEKYTAVYKWYESNPDNPDYPTLKTQSIENIYYGDFPEEEQIPQAVDNYYTDTQHFKNGKFPITSTDNTYTMFYSSEDHNMLTRIEDEPTCQAKGTTRHYCNKCDYYYIEQDTPDIVTHDYVAEEIAPTCTEEGYTKHTCRFCGDTYNTNTVEPTGHNDKRISIMAPTCELSGSVTYRCRVCSAEHTVEIPEKGHNMVTKVIEPTCEREGYTRYVCKNKCGIDYEDNFVDPLEHDYQLVVDKAPTCTEGGIKVYKCSRCDDSYTDTSEALTHNFSTSEITTKPTCTEDGVKTYYCSRCDEKKTEVIESLGHNYQRTTVSPNCTQQGYNVYHCSRCGDEYADDFTDALGHRWNKGEDFIPAKCGRDGVKTVTCERCNLVKLEKVEAIGHNYQPTQVVEPTCTEQGYTVFTCENCGDTYNDNFTDALTHNFSTSEITKQPTCTEKGVRTYFCSRCEATYEEPVDELGHDHIPNVVAPTCTEQGYTEYKCSRCEDSYRENYIDSLGHLFTAHFYNEDATCTANGTETATCDRCGVATETREVADTALGHDFGEWTVVTEATYDKEGEQIRTCSRCHEVERETIPVLEHEWAQVVEKPTNDNSGYVYYECDNCQLYANAVLVADHVTEVGDDIYESEELVKADTVEISAPAFNKYYSAEDEYNYSTRGASLKLSDPNFVDDNTTQDTRFTASLFVPSNIDASFSGKSDDKVIDFGFVYAQTQYIDNENDLELGKNAYSVSIPARNQGAGDISNWNGVSVHNDTFGGSTLTFNLLIKVKAINWDNEYCARAYVTYTQNGFTYTVYDNGFASRSVADIARAVVASDTETQEAKDYCQTKILDNLNVY